MTQHVRDTSGFAPASHQSQALCLGTLGVSLLLWPIAVWGFGSPLRFILGWSAAASGVWLLAKARRRWRMHGMEEGLFGDGFGEDLTPATIAAAHASLPPEVLANAQYQRLRETVECPVPDTAGRVRRGWGVITEASVVQGKLVSYTIKTTQKGALTSKKFKTEREQGLGYLLESSADTRWEVDSEPATDRVFGKLVKDMFPKAIAPEPPKSVVRDKADAIRRHADARWVLGIDTEGEEVGYGLTQGFPHVLVAGGTGGGKSVWARTMIETLRVQGFTCFIASGKETDFAALNGLPGIGMVAQGPEETAVMCRTVRKEMDRRFREERKLISAGNPPTFNYLPILVLLDEWGTTEIEMRSRYKDAQKFMDDLDFLLRKGRECKVHVALLSQNIRKTGAGAVPGPWHQNLTLTVALGTPEPVTLQSDAFTDEARPLAKLMGPKLKGKPGRGMIAERDTNAVVEFQSYYGWSPGYTSLDEGPEVDKKYAPPTQEVRAVWERWAPVSDAVPALYPRLGIKASGPEWTDGDSIDVIADTPTIPLTKESGDPIPEREKFDPRSLKWIGERPDDDFEGIGFDVS